MVNFNNLGQTKVFVLLKETTHSARVEWNLVFFINICVIGCATCNNVWSVASTRLRVIVGINVYYFCDVEF